MLLLMISGIKVIFVDIDGVLNSEKTVRTREIEEVNKAMVGISEKEMFLQKTI